MCADGPGAGPLSESQCDSLTALPRDSPAQQHPHAPHQWGLASLVQEGEVAARPGLYAVPRSRYGTGGASAPVLIFVFLCGISTFGARGTGYEHLCCLARRTSRQYIEPQV